MAERPIFVPIFDGQELVREIFFALQWSSGFAAIQKQKNIRALHQAAADAGFSPLLEISTKSENKRGRHLSAFHIKVPTKNHGKIKLELAFQGSKVFERGGPFTDLYDKKDHEIGEAKRDSRLKESGALVGFRFDGVDFPLFSLKQHFTTGYIAHSYLSIAIGRRSFTNMPASQTLNLIPRSQSTVKGTLHSVVFELDETWRIG